MGNGLPFFSLAIRMNLLAAVAGALTVGWVYKLIWFFVFETMREQSAVSHASRTAQFGGLVAALAVGVNMPFWLVATTILSPLSCRSTLEFCDDSLRST